jgi:hypothetical protein
MDRAAVERWLLKRGVPHLIEGYAPSTDVFTRVWWLLALVFLAESVGAADQDLSLVANIGAVAAGLALLLAGVVLVNRQLGRGLIERPTRLGTPELTLFVVLPALLPLLSGFDLRQAGLVAGGNLTLLVVLYVVTGYGLVPLSRWAVTQLASQLLDLANLLVRTLPLLAVFSMFLFLNAELWQVASDAPWYLLAAACALLVLVGVLFTMLRVPQEIGDLRAPDTWEEVDLLTFDTPAERIAHTGHPGDTPELSVRARVNLVLVGLFRLGVQIAVVSLLVGGFYVVFGLLVVREETIAQWTTNGSASHNVLWRGEIADASIVLTKSLLKVAAFLAAFGGLQVTVSALTDPTYREAFFDDLVAELRQVLAVRAAYLAAPESPDP